MPSATSCSSGSGEQPVSAPQRRGKRRPLLIIHCLSLVPEHQLPVGPLQDLHPETGIAGPLCPRQQLQDPPNVFTPGQLLVHRGGNYGWEVEGVQALDGRESATRIRRSTMRWWRSISSSSARRSRYSGRSTFSAAHRAAIFPYSLRNLGLCRDCDATVIPAPNTVSDVRPATPCLP